MGSKEQSLGECDAGVDCQRFDLCDRASSPRTYLEEERLANRSGQPIANHDLWDDLLKARAKAGIRVDFAFQHGKRSKIAKRVDKAAKAAAQRGGFDVDSGYLPGGVSRSMVKGGQPAQPYPASDRVAVIRPYVKKIMFKGENRISFNLFDEATQVYSGKFFAYAVPPLASELHLGNGHRVRFNADPRYPQILARIEGVPLPKPTRRDKKSSQP